MEVKVTSRKLIKPSTPTPEHFRTVKLSFFDHIAPPSYTSCIFFYPNVLSESNSTKQMISHLQTSLSEALSMAFPFAGKLNEEDNSVHCDDEGAEFREAQVTGWTLEKLMKDEWKATLMRQLLAFPNELDHSSTRLLVVQFNVFMCGAIALGLSLSHKLVDGFTFYSFVKGWAESKKCLSFDSANYLTLTKNYNEIMDKVPIPDNKADNFITKRFVFSAEALSKLKGIYDQASRVEVSVAIIWKAKIMVAAKSKNAGIMRDSLFITPFNIRGKTRVSFPIDAAGNFFTLVPIRFQAQGRCTEVEVTRELLNLVRNGISTARNQCAKIGEIEDLFRFATAKTSEVQRELRKREADACLFTSLCRFPCYDADFGWGKPALVASGHKPLDMVEMRDTCCGTGIEAWVTLEPSHMVLFQQDPHVLAFTNLM